jgi:hypothetical protein
MSRITSAIWSRTYKVIFFVLAAILLSLSPTPAYATDASPQSFTYQGYLTDNSGTPLTGINTLIVSIYDPTGTCLLYEETQNVDLTNTSGVFSILVGSQTGDPKRTGIDPGISMVTVYANTAPVVAIVPNGANCALALGYKPQLGDERLLRFTVNGTTLTPDQTLGSVPQAVVAQSLQGQTPIDFVQITGNATPYSIAQANWDLLFGTGGGGAPGSAVVNASTLHRHDDLYLQIGDTSAQNIGSGGFYSSGIVGIGMGAQPAGVQLEVQNTSNAQVGEIVKGAAAQASDYFEVQTSGGAVLDKIDSSGNLFIGGTTAGFQAATYTYVGTALSNYLPLGGGTLTGAVTGTSFTTTLQGGVVVGPFGAAAGNTGEIRFQELTANGAKYVGFKAPDSIAGNVIWTLPNADGSSAQVLTTDGSGNLSWASAGGATSVAGAGNLTTVGAVPYVSASGTLNQDATNFFWDSTNHRLGIGNAAPASSLNVTTAPAATTAVGSVSFGEGGWAGTGAPNFVGSNANGTELAINATGAYIGDLANFEVAGISKFKVDYQGNVVAGGNFNASSTSTINGTVNINTSGAGNTVIGNGGTGTVAIGNSTGGVALDGNVTEASFNFTQSGNSSATIGTGTGSTTIGTGTGNVTIGNSTDTVAINAGTTVTSTTSPQLTVKYDNADNATVGVASNGFTTISTNGSAPGFDFTGGNVGIGAAGPTSLFQTTDTAAKIAAYTGVLHSVTNTSATNAINKVRPIPV